MKKIQGWIKFPKDKKEKLYNYYICKEDGSSCVRGESKNSDCGCYFKQKSKVLEE